MLANKLSSLQEKRFTGRLDINLRTGKHWQIYLCLGRMLWADGGEHPYRFWSRQLSQYCPHVNFNNNIVLIKQFECWKYRILTELVENKQITFKKFTALVKKNISQILFDIIQTETTQKLQYTYKSTSGDFLLECGIKLSLTFVDIGQVISLSQQDWIAWRDRGFEQISPNLAPILSNISQLQREVSPNIYHNFIKLIDGKRTLRDLAVQINKDVLKLTSSLVPYINKGFVKLIEIPDLPQHKTLFNSCMAKEKYRNAVVRQPIIAGIDDSSQVIKIMAEIVRKEGYKFIGIQDPLQAITKLVSSNPELIFLDIGMPIINGYELCAQLKRISKLKAVPIVMLTGQDGIVDRLRAKVSGASYFINKPINSGKIASAMNKFLAAKNNDNTEGIYPLHKSTNLKQSQLAYGS